MPRAHYFASRFEKALRTSAYWVIVSISTTSAFGMEGQDPSNLNCVTTLQTAFYRGLITVADSNENYFRAYLHPSFPLGIEGHLEGGQLRFTVVTRGPLGEPVQPFLQAKPLLGAMMAHFEERVQTVKVSWTSEFARTNLDKFIDLRNQGWPENAAFFSTWTGRNLLLHGFVTLQKIEVYTMQSGEIWAVEAIVRRVSGNRW